MCAACSKQCEKQTTTPTTTTTTNATRGLGVLCHKKWRSSQQANTHTQNHQYIRHCTKCARRASTFHKTAQNRIHATPGRPASSKPHVSNQTHENNDDCFVTLHNCRPTHPANRATNHISRMPPACEAEAGIDSPERVSQERYCKHHHITTSKNVPTYFEFASEPFSC